jgi:hypothetical protein
MGDDLRDNLPDYGYGFDVSGWEFLLLAWEDGGHLSDYKTQLKRNFIIVSGLALNLLSGFPQSKAFQLSHF